ncbi:MAG: hypothetical protein KKA64_01465 [Nanoarchaeota archaeon]|nr:hypothetical protein [Nanoarchaeota archaeon]
MIINKFNRNKRGDIAVTILVLLVFITTIISIFVFLTNSRKIEANIVDANVVNSVYLEEGEAKFYLGEAGEKAATKVIKEAYELFDKPTDEYIKTKFSEEFKSEIKISGISEELKSQIEENKFEVSLENRKIKLTLKEAEFYALSPKLEVAYKPVISMAFAF